MTTPDTQSMAVQLKDKIYKNIIKHSPHVSHLIHFDTLAMLDDIASALTAHTEAALKDDSRLMATRQAQPEAKGMTPPEVWGEKMMQLYDALTGVPSANWFASFFKAIQQDAIQSLQPAALKAEREKRELPLIMDQADFLKLKYDGVAPKLGGGSNDEELVRSLLQDVDRTLVRSGIDPNKYVFGSQAFERLIAERYAQPEAPKLEDEK